MSSTMLKIIDLCKKAMDDYNVYSLEVHMAKNIICKVYQKNKLTRMDLDFITQLQIKYGI